MNKEKARGKVIMALALGLTLTSVSPAFAASYTDTYGHWALSSIERLSNYELISGYNGQFRPDDNITRGEMAVIVDRIMGYNSESKTKFTDLDNQFYRQPILRANEAGVISGDGNTVRPKDPITRQEAVVMLCRAFHMEERSLSPSKFKDYNKISEWAKKSIGALAEKGFVSGDTNGNFNPTANITRAEVTAILDRMMGEYISKSSTVTNNINGNTVINTSGVELKGVNISGDLILSEGVKDGDITLVDTTVNGKVYVLGGGSSKAIKIKGNTKISNLESLKKNSDIKFEVASASKINTLNIRNGNKVTIDGTIDNINAYNEKIALEVKDSDTKNIKLYGSNGSLKVADESNLGTITIGKDASSTSINLEKGSKASKIETAGEGSKLDISGKVTDIDIQEYADKATLTINSNASVSNIDIDAEDAKVSGNGKVTRINANADDAQINIKNTKVYVGKNADNVRVNNSKVKAGSTVNSSDTEDYEDWDDDDWDDVEINNIDVEDENEIVVTLNKKLPNKLSKNDFEIERVNSGSDPSIKSYDYVSSGSKKYKEYTLTTSDLKYGEKYGLTIELPSGRDISKRFTANYDEDNKKDEDDYDYPSISNVSTTRIDETTATLYWKSNNEGRLYYKVVGDTETVTVSEVKNDGKSISISSGSSDTRITGLEAGKAYRVYMVSYYNSNSSLYGPYTIGINNGSSGGNEGGTEPEKPDEPDEPEKTKITVDSISNISGTTKFSIKLSEATKEKLTKEMFELTNSNGKVKIDSVDSSDNKTYTVETSESKLTDGSYTVTITFSDGVKSSSSTTVDVGYPELSSLSAEKAASNTALISLTSNKSGYIYYYVGDTHLDSVEEVMKKGNRLSIKNGEDSFEVVINKNASKNYISIVAVSKSGVENTSVYKLEV